MLAKLIHTADEDVARHSKQSPAVRGDLERARQLLHTANDPRGALKIYDTTVQRKGLSEIDLWDIHAGRGMALVALGDVAGAHAAFVASQQVAKPLRWRLYVESTFNVACAASELGMLPEALSAVEELLGIERLAGDDPENSKGSKLATDESLAKVRAHPQFAALVAKYRRT